MRAGIEIEAARAVAHEGVVVPTVPELGYDIDEFAGALVAFGVRRELGVAEIAGGVVIGRRHDIPGRAAAGDVVERSELARDVVGFGEARRDRATEADAGWWRRRAR